jgi:hypothetical protein
LKPKSALVLDNLGTAFLSKQMYDSAFNCFNKALAVDCYFILLIETGVYLHDVWQLPKSIAGFYKVLYLRTGQLRDLQFCWNLLPANWQSTGIG